MRMFVALVPPETAVEDLDAFLAVRRDAAPFRWTLPEHLHVTLAFLADVADRHLDEVVERLGRAAARRSPFSTRIAGGGAFPDAARARILWAGLDLDEHGRTELSRAATGARAAATRTGVAVAGQRFRPHVTVARLGRPAGVSDWVRLLDGYAGPTWRGDRAHPRRVVPRGGPLEAPALRGRRHVPARKDLGMFDPGGRVA